MVNNTLNQAGLVPTAGQNFFLVFSTFAVRFQNVGTYNYVCGLHTWMVKRSFWVKRKRQELDLLHEQNC